MATFVKKGKTIRFGDPIGVNFVQSDGNFSSDSDATVRHFILRGVTTDATETEIFVGNNTNSRMNLITDSTWFFEVDIVARRTDVDASACWRFTGAIDNNAVGGTAVAGSIQKEEFANDSTYNTTVEADSTNDALIVKVTGVGTDIIRWVGHCKTVQVIG